MLTQPPIEGIWTRARPFHSELCFDTSHLPIAAGACRFIPPMRDIIWSTCWPKRFFYPRVAMDFYQSMTTKQHRVEQPGRPQPARYQLPEHLHVIYLWVYPLPLTISRAPPVTPASSEPSTSAEPRMAIPILEYRELCRSLQTLTYLRAALLRRWQLFEHAGADVDHPGSAHCHLKAAPASSRSSLVLSISPPPLQCHTRRPQSLRPS
ncbi:hypothetical protein CK203_105705 [Vitis vinifera]|uniref:Uncharacterized protein n=1 Tax=Vitis vinifera TaxID=29760 RepID=A0A438BPH0_VITVI|nr:hypothetical protein CK203_105705 [Vitis vinifera]